MSEELLLLYLHKPKTKHAPARVVFAVVGAAVVLYGMFAAYIAIATYSGQTATEVVSASATPVPYVAGSLALIPARLSIKTVGINAAVEEVGDTQSGAVATPKKISDVGWYRSGVVPGNPGNAVFVGHVNNTLTKAGVFEHLADLRTGDRIFVLDAKGNALQFAVTKIEDYTNGTAPLHAIFSKEGAPGLVLITCSGDWDPRVRSYEKRLVVYALLLAQ